MIQQKTYSELLRSPHWQKKRLEIMNRDKFICQRCGSENKTLHVHHFKYIDGRMPWDYPDYMLTTLCEDCHLIEHLKIDPVLLSVLQHFIAAGNKEVVSIINQKILEKYGKRSGNPVVLE